MSFQHLVNEVEGTETGCFGTEARAAEFHTFTCERTGVFASQFLIHTIHITDFTSSYADVTGRHIHVRSEMTPQLQHKCLAETHDFSITLSAWREIGTAFTATHGQSCQ